MTQALNLEYEADRIGFYIKRDGVQAAIEKMKELRFIYRKAALTTKLKHGRSYPYRRGYIESAMSCRHLLRVFKASCQ
jgi:hypothetical protein